MIKEDAIKDIRANPQLKEIIAKQLRADVKSPVEGIRNHAEWMLSELLKEEKMDKKQLLLEVRNSSQRRAGLDKV